MLELGDAVCDGTLFSISSWLQEPMKVDRENRVLRGVSVITRGEALGHELWIDEAMLLQVVRESLRRRKGVPMRWTHPSLCNDTMGKQVGRATNFVYDSESGSVRADVYLYKKATGQRAEMIESILDLAEEDPEVLGLSIVFERDLEGEDEFIAKNTVNGSFISPDSENKRNLRHARLAKLEWIDFVNEPAANPNGLFSAASTRDVVFALFDAFLRKEKNPFLEIRFREVFGISMNEAIALLDAYLEDRGLEIASANATRSSMRHTALKAISYERAHPNGTPKADESEPWNGPAEVAKADVDDLKVMCAWVEDGKEDLKTAYKFPHHKASPPHSVVWRAVANAVARLPQANIPSEDVPGVQRHLAAHYREFGKEPPFVRQGADWAGYWSEVAACPDALSDAELCAILEKYGLHEESCAILGEKNKVSDVESIEEIAKILEDSFDRFKRLIGKE